MSVDERWRPVVGYEGYYEVSDQGRVRSVDRIVPRGAGTIRVRERLLTQPVDDAGRPKVGLWANGTDKNARVHQLVARAFVPGEAPGLEVCHNDGNPANNAWTNLRWDTRAANERDKLVHGTHFHASKTHCKNGHPFTAANTYIAPKTGQRVCRTCRRERGLRWYHKQVSKASVSK